MKYYKIKIELFDYDEAFSVGHIRTDYAYIATFDEKIGSEYEEITAEEFAEIEKVIEEEFAEGAESARPLTEAEQMQIETYLNTAFVADMMALEM